LVSRAGENTVSEIIITRRPAVLIPIPWTYLDEQTLNAKYAKEKGIAKILYQDDLSAGTLRKRIDLVVRKKADMVKDSLGFYTNSPDDKAAEKVANDLKEIAK
jgi:UDP-N-acetylglucosamine:LPS N-acetylglucosamine transferase